MEPPNLHQYHLQYQDYQIPLGISPSSSSSSSSSSCYGVSTTTSTHIWTPCTILNSGGSNLSPYSGGAINNITSNNSTDSLLRHQQQHQSGTSLISMTQDLGFHWTNDNNNTLMSQLVKQENPFTCQMLKSPSSSIEEAGREISDMNARFLLGTFSSGIQDYNQGGDHDFCYSSTNSSSTSSGRLISQIYPTVNVSNLNMSQASLASASCSLDMNLQHLDLVNNARYGGSTISQAYGLPNHFQHSCDSPTSISGFSNGVAEAKRSCKMLEPNKATQNAPKKSRVESRATCPPFKVRKEKLGDRIAALQQLVAPFGKTDTASVLMEAIGYIKFLQNQVETLSVPYMKSSRNKPSRSLHGGVGDQLNGSEEIKRDLRSRGLCLVPLSCLTYVTDSGGGVWPPPNFSGGT